MRNLSANPYPARRRAMIAPPLYQRMLVVFSDDTHLPWLRLLKQGFRHCFVAFSTDGRWLTVDALSHRTEVSIQPVGADFDLASYYRSKGMTVADVQPAPVPLRTAPPLPFTCVETAKRLLGIHAWSVVTPWQLYRHLEKRTASSDPGPSAAAPVTTTSRAGMVAKPHFGSGGAAVARVTGWVNRRLVFDGLRNILCRSAGKMFHAVLKYGNKIAT